MTPSEAFSATVSTAAFVTPSSVSASTAYDHGYRLTCFFQRSVFQTVINPHTLSFKDRLPEAGNDFRNFPMKQWPWKPRIQCIKNHCRNSEWKNTDDQNFDQSAGQFLELVFGKIFRILFQGKRSDCRSDRPWYSHLGLPNIRSSINPAASAMVWYIKAFFLPDVYIQNISALHLFITVQYLLSYVYSLSGILTAVLAALTKKSLRHLRIAIKIQVRKPRHHGICAMNAIPFPVARRFFRIKIVPAVFRIEIM